MMHEQEDNYSNGENTNENVNRYESMVSRGASLYFDVDDYVDIVTHYIDANKLIKAKKACEFALKVHPDAAELKLKYAQLLVSLGEPIKSLKWLKKVAELKAGNHEYYLTQGVSNILIGNIEKAEKLLLKALKLTPDEEKEEFLGIVSYAFEDSDNELVAIKFLKLGLKKFPDNKELLFRLAINFERTGYNEQSIDCYQKLLDIDPFAENIWYNLGIIYNKVEQYDKAVEAYDYTIALDSGHFDALFNKANTYANWERYDHAIEIYAEYLQVHEESLVGHFYIGECYVQIKDYDTAVKHFKRALEIHVEYPEAYYGLGLVYSDKGELDEAVDMFKKTLSLEHEHADALFSLSVVLSKLEKYEEAVHHLEKVIAINMFDSEAWLLMATCLDAIGENNKCISQLTSAVDYNPDLPELMYALSAYLVKYNFIDLGVSWFLKAYSVDKDYSIVEDIYQQTLSVLEIHNIINIEK